MTMISEPSNATSYAPSPFDHPKADLILRSADGIDFRVSASILEISSEVFTNLCGDGNPGPDESRDGCPIVRVQEHSKTLHSLLSLIYPVELPVLNDIPHIQACLAAALKYGMKRSISLTRTALSSMIPEAPLRVWAVAARYGLEIEAQNAAAELLRQGITILEEHPPELEQSGLNAGHYFRLLKYQHLAGIVEQGFTLCGPPAPPALADLQSFPVASDNPLISSQSYTRIQSLADVIIRSVDGREFPAHKAFLSLASPVLAALLVALPLRDDIEGVGVTTADGVAVGDSLLPVVSLEEDAATLAIVLGLCYPRSEGGATVVPNPQILSTVMDAARKYGMSGAQRFLQEEWKKSLDSDPLRAYIIATRHRGDVEAREAARMLLDRKLEDYYTPILEVTSVSTYRSLVKYERACKTALGQHVQSCFHGNIGSGPSETVNHGGSESPYLPMKSESCRGHYVGMRARKSMIPCHGVSNLVSPSGACEPCIELAETIAGVLRQLELEPNALMSMILTRKSRSAAAMSQNLLCPHCSRPRDYVKLTAIYDELYTRVESIIHNAYTEHCISTVSVDLHSE